jgi:hypothetical protein
MTEHKDKAFFPLATIAAGQQTRLTAIRSFLAVEAFDYWMPTSAIWRPVFPLSAR